MPAWSDRSRIRQRDRAASLPPFDLQHLADGHRHTLVLAGELDMVSSADLEAVISDTCRTEGISRLVLDLRQLTFMDMIGLRMVLFAKELCEWHRCEFGLIPGPASVQRVFELTGLAGDLPFAPEPAS